MRSLPAVPPRAWLPEMGADGNCLLCLTFQPCSAKMSTMADKKAYFASDLGAIIRAERKALRLSQAELAERVRISRQTIIDLEKGGNVSLHVVNKVMAGLGKVLTVTDARLSMEEAARLFEEDD